MAGLLARDDVTAIFESVCNVAAGGGLWSEDTALVVGELARALTISPQLPAAATTTTVDALPKSHGAVTFLSEPNGSDRAELWRLFCAFVRAAERIEL